MGEHVDGGPLATSEAGQRGKRSAELRDYFDLTQAELAAWLGVTQPVVARWETSGRPMPYDKLADTFGVSVDWLMQRCDNMWGCRVRKVRAVAVAYITEHHGDDNGPSRRFASLVQALREAHPDLLTERYIALVAGMDPTTLRDVTLGAQGNMAAYERFAEWLQIPVAWLLTGDASVVSYEHAVALAQHRGVAPERLVRLLQAM